MPTYQADAIVLRRLDYGEADRILTLLTREHGKLAAIAKGSRRAKARSGSGLVLDANPRAARVSAAAPGLRQLRDGAAGIAGLVLALAWRGPVRALRRPRPGRVARFRQRTQGAAADGCRRRGAL